MHATRNIYIYIFYKKTFIGDVPKNLWRESYSVDVERRHSKWCVEVVECGGQDCKVVGCGVWEIRRVGVAVRGGCGVLWFAV